MSSRPVIIGGGHNGLTAAFYLARAGLKPLVLERRDEVGGGAVTREIAPGFHVPALSHDVMLWREVAREMDLARHGFEPLRAEVEVLAPAVDGPPLLVYEDVARTAEALRPVHAQDAAAYPAFRQSLDRVAGVIASLLTFAPPNIDAPAAADLWRLLRIGRRVRALGRRDGYRLLRWAPMPAADLVREAFADERLCAALAAPGVSGTMLGPRSAGSGLVLLLREAHRQLAGGTVQVRGGPGALARAMAAAVRAAGAEIRTGIAVERILTRDQRVVGVVAGGEELAASLVVSAVDPKTTFLRLVDPMDLTPDFVAKMRNYRAAGTVAKVNLALSELPGFRGVHDAAALGGRIHIGPRLNDLERAFDHAKYGEVSTRPWLDVRIPSILDPQLAPAGAHVMSIYVHYAPRILRGTTWAEAAPVLQRRVLASLEEYAPGISALVMAAEVITPEQLELEYGLAGGHIFHGELALDQLFTMRPLLGCGRYGSPVSGLHLCGGGTHPGGFLTGASGKLAAGVLLHNLRRTA